MLSTYDKRTVSTDADPHALLEAAGRIKFHLIALQTKNGKSEVRQHHDGTLVIHREELPSRNVGGVGFAMHPSDVHLVDSRLTRDPITSNESELDTFHEGLEDVIHNKKFFYKFVVVNFNAKLGKAEGGE
ncbi:hypothetical protein Y032_0266g729 [Ancylostoma ceylanicum]|uniref:Uncharacterized protein n=1 Tax=Ancylostoma ceylanicum TaxID=53326 RepID=A0A016SA42_9BILA|nr:hypothetical protein Y032_0266g729 [Ancylostoma ceylanicum]